MLRSASPSISPKNIYSMTIRYCTKVDLNNTPKIEKQSLLSFTFFTFFFTTIVIITAHLIYTEFVWQLDQFTGKTINNSKNRKKT